MKFSQAGIIQANARRITKNIAWLTPLVLAGIAFLSGAIALRNAAPLTHHMGMHILAMNGIAPLLAISAILYQPQLAEGFASGRLLAIVSALQIVVLWLVHTPAWVEFSLPSLPVYSFTQLILFGAGLIFWLSVFGQRREGRAYALLALLVTGKLFCLLGALLVFSPRAVYARSIWEICAPGTSPTQLIEDQHLAGLLMLTACPLSYVLAGIVIAAVWLRELSNAPRRRLV